MPATAEERLRNRLTNLYEDLNEDEKALLVSVLARADGAEVKGFAGLSAVGLLGMDLTPRPIAGYNEASTTLASIQKGLHDTANTDIGKI